MPWLRTPDFQKNLEYRGPGLQITDSRFWSPGPRYSRFILEIWSLESGGTPASFWKSGVWSLHRDRYKPVPIGTSCTGPMEPRTKNQDCRARPPRNLGSWFLVLGAGAGTTCTDLYRFVPARCKFKDFKGFRKFKCAGPFPKIAILSQNFKDLRNLRILKKLKRAGPFPK